ncbi:MAG: Crp/Fnr family transcriptional regulator [Caulobacteraceae bacterium]
MGRSADLESVPPTHPAAHCLDRLHGLDGDDRVALARLFGATQWVGPGEVVAPEGGAAGGLCALLDGWACRCKDFHDGRRQIIALLIPGDLLLQDHVPRAGAADHAVITLTEATIAWIPQEAMATVLRDHPGIARALRTAAAVELSALRAWLVNLGLRSAQQRMAHLFCELAARLEPIPIGLNQPDRDKRAPTRTPERFPVARPVSTFAEGVAALADRRSPTAFDLPLTQQALGWALGLTTVHVNRVLQQLRRDGLIDFRGGVLAIPDPARLEALAGFDRAYLAA